MSNIVLPVSLGEALDKLTILDIKLEKISDNRKQDVQKEYDILYQKLEEFIVNFNYHYKLLKEINKIIWDTQDNFHNIEGDDSKFTPLCRKILIENDRRFRVKKKINNIASSALNEQKGYAKNSICFYGPLELGNMILLNGCIRYLSTVYDSVYLIVSKVNEENIKTMYKDDIDIQIIILEDAVYNKNKIEMQMYLKEKCKCDVIMVEDVNLVYENKTDLVLPENCREDYFYIQPTLNSTILYNELKKLNIPYIIIHEKSNKNSVDISNKYINSNYLIININHNVYNKDHKYYNIVSTFTNKPLFDYYKMIENASELHLIESSAYALAAHLNLEKVKTKICYNNNNQVINTDFFNKFKFYNKVSKVAFITGVYGQDGQYLIEFLKNKDYKIYGMVRTTKRNKLNEKEDLLYPDIECIGDITNEESVLNCIYQITDDYDVLEIYNFASQSVVFKSFSEPNSKDNNGVLTLLEYIRYSPNKHKIKYYQASSSEIYGLTKTYPQDENTSFNPRTPYGVSKLTSYWLTRIYRECYNIFAVNGILFNHESVKRNNLFVTKKIIDGLKDIKNNKLEYIELGNINASRDWGYAKDYVEGMWKMMQYEKARDWVLATGEKHTVREFIEIVCKELQINLKWENEGLDEVGIDVEHNKIIIKISNQYYRPVDFDNLIGNSNDARNLIGWKPSVNFKELVKLLLE